MENTKPRVGLSLNSPYQSRDRSCKGHASVMDPISRSSAREKKCLSKEGKLEVSPTSRETLSQVVIYSSSSSQIIYSSLNCRHLLPSIPSKQGVNKSRSYWGLVMSPGLVSEVPKAEISNLLHPFKISLCYYHIFYFHRSSDSHHGKRILRTCQ